MSPKHREEREALIKLCWACAPGTGAGRRHWRRSPLKVADDRAAWLRSGAALAGAHPSQGFAHPILQHRVPWHPGAGHSWGRCLCLGGTGMDGGETISKEPFTAGRAVAVAGSQRTRVRHSVIANHGFWMAQQRKSLSSYLICLCTVLRSGCRGREAPAVPEEHWEAYFRCDTLKFRCHY